MPMGYLDTNYMPGEPKMIVEDMEIPFIFDGRKFFQYIRKPTVEELETLPEVEITAPTPYNPSSSTYLQPQRKKVKQLRSKIPIEE